MNDVPYNSQFETWKEEWWDAASTVCGAYNLASLMADQGMVDRSLIVREWRTSIITNFDKCKDFLKQVREENGDERYWSGFEILNAEALKTLN